MRASLSKFTNNLGFFSRKWIFQNSPQGVESLRLEGADAPPPPPKSASALNTTLKTKLNEDCKATRF